MVETKIDSGGQEIDATLFPLQKTGELRPAFVFFHGWTSRKDRHLIRAEKLASLGVTTLVISFRGHGESEGEFGKLSRKDHLQDALVSYDYLASLPGVDSKRIGVFGSSYGGYIASVLSGERPLAYLALWDPALYKDQDYSTPTALLVDQNPDVFKQSNLSPQENRALRAILDFQGDLLIIRSGKADVVPLGTINNYLQTANKDRLTSVVIEGADHTMSDAKHNQEVVQTLYNWFKEKINRTPR